MSAPAPAPPRDVPLEDADLDALLAGPPPPVGERLRGVFLDPLGAFSQHDGGWGWVLPWLLVAGVGVLYGLLVLARVDLGARAQAEFERAMEQMPTARRKALDDQPESKDQLETSRKMNAFLGKLGLVVGPPLGGLIGLVAFGGLAWLAGLLLGPKDGGPDLLRGLSLAAWAGLAELPGYLARGVAVLLGNPAPTTSLANLADPLESPVAAALLGRLDVVLLYYYLLFGVGLCGSLRLTPRRAGLVAGGAWLGLTGLIVGLALLGRLLRGMGGAG